MIFDLSISPTRFISALWELWTQSYWRDEAFRILMSRHSLVEIVHLTYGDGQPPLYYFLLKLWAWLFGDGEVITRALSVVMFEILFFLILYFSKKLKPKNGLFAISLLLLTIINPSLLYYAFEARMYLMFILVVFLANTSLYFKKYFFWAIFTTLGLYTHNFMVFVFAANLVWLFLEKDRDIKVKKAILAVILLYLPWLGIFLHQATLIIGDFWVEKLSWQIVSSSLAAIYSGYDGSSPVLRSFFTFFSLGILLIMIFSPKNRLWKFNMVAFWLPFFFVVFVSFFIRPIFLTRYLSFLIIPLLIIISSYVSALPKKIGIVLLIFFIIFSLQIFNMLIPARRKPDIRSSVIDIIGQIRPGNSIYTSSLNYFETKYYFAKFASIEYTNGIPIKIFEPTGKIPFFVGRVLIKDEDISSKISTEQRIFAIDQNNKVTVFSRF